MTNQQFFSVWDATEDTVEDAAKMKFRSQLMIQLNGHVVRRGLHGEPTLMRFLASSVIPYSSGRRIPEFIMPAGTISTLQLP